MTKSLLKYEFAPEYFWFVGCMGGGLRTLHIILRNAACSTDDLFVFCFFPCILFDVRKSGRAGGACVASLEMLKSPGFKNNKVLHLNLNGGIW
jgi:hypothetical protein